MIIPMINLKRSYLRCRAGSMACVIVAMLIGGSRMTRAEDLHRTSRVPDDDGSILCNHFLIPGTTFSDVRCKDAVAPGRMLLFSRGEKPTIELPIQNDRPEAIPAEYVLQLCDRNGKQLGREAGSVLLRAETATNIRYTFDTGYLKYGVCSLTLQVTSGAKPLTGREYYVGIISNTVIPKSADGQFLYGLAPNYGGVVAKAPEPAKDGRKARQGQCDLLGWIDASGADILRTAGFGIGPGAWGPDLDALEIIRRHGLRVMGMAWPLSPTVSGAGTKPEDAFAEKDVKKWTSLAEETARRAPYVIYWELGNEPDLGYPGIDCYTSIYEATYQAIKRGNPHACIMNGGLTFFGEKGPSNSRRFLELVNTGRIDAIAYHGHGPGSVAERKIFEQARKTAAEFGKGDKPLIDTESGMFVGSKKQEDAQAAMVVEKQAYAQAVGLKFLMTFCLHAFRHGDLGYGLLRSDQEPNPAFIAYRAMTEHLKGLAFQKKLEISRAFSEGYSFAEADGSRRACIFWSDQPAFYNVSLKVAESPERIKNLRFMDIYGNPSPAEADQNGIVRVEVTESPVYLLWDALDPHFQASVAASMLRTPDMARVVPGVPSPLVIRVENSSDTELAATLSARITSRGEASITPEQQRLTIPPKSSVPAQLSVRWQPPDEGIVWPTSWLVYTDLRDPDLSALKEAPATIQDIRGRNVEPVNGVINLLRPGELPREKRPGFVFGTVQSDRDQVVRIACTADWWMELRLNGEIICSTMENGNEGKTLAERPLDLPLKKGTNLVSVKILGGKGGWSVALASPSELPALLDPRKPVDCIDLSLLASGREIARERLALHPVRPVAPIGAQDWAGPKEGWPSSKPDFVLEGANVVNFFDKLPDSSKFWHGDSDLSAKAWIRSDDRRLYLFVWVQDDKDITGTDPAKLSAADSLEVGISAESNMSSSDSRPTLIYTIGRIDGKTVISRDSPSQEKAKTIMEATGPDISARVERSEQGTFYRISLDRALVGSGVFRLNFLIHDNDDGYPKQLIEYTKGLAETLDPSLWQEFILAPSAK